MPLPAIIGAGAGLLGSLFGSIINSDETKSANDKNEALQRDLANNSIRMRRDDANRSGIHPLYAMGIQPYNAPATHVAPNTGDYVSQMGQDISRAVKATGNEMERLQIRLLTSQIEGQDIDNASRRSQLARDNSAQLGPPFPIDVQPLKPTATGPNKGLTVGSVPEVTWANTAQGGRVPVKSKDVQEAYEDDIVGNILWQLRNNILPPGGIAGSSPDEIWVPGLGWLKQSGGSMEDYSQNLSTGR